MLRKLKLIKMTSDSGFSILEVLVAILVISGFLLGSLQATVLATFFRVQAQDKQEAANWVQQDLELIRYRAFMLDKNSDGTYNATGTGKCGTYGTRLQTTITTAGYTATQSITINTRNYSVTRAYVAPTASPNILQISYTVAYASSHARYKGSGADNTITTLSTEVRPNAALSCS
jgi:prepilin-type N-terminal cleavage/methylation domain-containing protein